MKVKDCMTGEVYCVKPNTTACEIAKLMEKNHIGCVPVCDEQNCIVGMVTDRDIILRSIANNKDVKTTTASEIMTTNICTCNENDEVCNVEKKMSTNQIRRIPVVDNNKVIGILTLGDLAHYNKEIGQEEIGNTIEDICQCRKKKKNNC